MSKEAIEYKCPLCDGPIGGYDNFNSSIWCDNKDCPLGEEEISMGLWLAIHKRLGNE